MPHEELTRECETCHAFDSFKEVSFEHSSTDFTLIGRHNKVNCASCHSLKDFSQIDSACVSCHRDIHEAKLGPNCDRCHTPNGWGIFNIEDIHLESSFPLMGRHAQVDCQGCHKSLPRGDLSFNTTRCVECHEKHYLEVQAPNHVAGGFPTDCQECHQMNSWRPALMTSHDAFFPIFSGTHDGEWDECANCHTDPASFQIFNCLTCHEHKRDRMDASHQGISGYTYNSLDCLICHPTGEKQQYVAHDAEYFPIFSSAHSGVWDGCYNCHTVVGDRSQVSCLECHEQATASSVHTGITSYSWETSACLTCHPDGTGGEYPAHDAEYFPIYSGNHAGVWMACATCHTDPNNRSVYDCFACHEQAPIDIVHQGMLSYVYESTTCFSCHPVGVREDYPEHDGAFFPIYTGGHSGVWSDCSDCHTDPNDRAVFTCITCHNQPTVDGVHVGIPGYLYSSNSCFSCHPTGDPGEYLVHDGTYFPIYSGNHAGVWTACATCHIDPNNRSVYDCLACHEQAPIDIVHQGMLSYVYESTTCMTCHPSGAVTDYLEHDGALFPIYSGNHTGVWADCATCHIDPNNRAVFDCLVCHEQGTTDGDHTGIPGYQYESNSCYDCHPTGDGGQFTLHDALYFPIYSGTHNAPWASCSTCHTDMNDATVFSCYFGCHRHNESRSFNDHFGVSGYVWDSYACYSCHPTGVAH